MNYFWLPSPIKAEIKRVLRACLKARDWYAGGSPEPLLLLGHIRSGSTLLHHLLVSHPEIIGCGERKVRYQSSIDFDQLRVDVHLRRGQLLRWHRYVTDQVNHNDWLASEALLNHPQVRTIFLIREPCASVASMLSMTSVGGMTAEDAIRYYRDRLSTLSRYAQIIQEPARAFLLTYDDLIINTELTLQSLQCFLGLQTKLTDHYQTFNFTGIRGDPSPHIHAGRILRDIPRRRIVLDPAILASLLDVYQDCRQVLQKHCLSPTS